MKYDDLDAAFLKYTGVTAENQRAIQSYYLPFFSRCRSVIDLGCGQGDFVSLLIEQGIDALGVDGDAACAREAEARGARVVCADVFDHLRAIEPSSADGIFSAHLVEHLPYARVLELLELSFRALRPGGVIVVATPNARALYPHLESFYMHFGHVTFYHPVLLSFFLDYTGYTDIKHGENPNLRSPLWGNLADLFQDHGPGAHIASIKRDLPLSGSSGLRRLSRRVKMFLVRMIVLPYVDQLIAQNNTIHARLAAVSQAVETMRATLDRSIECYVHARKPLTGRAG